MNKLEGPWKLAWKRLRRNRVAMTGAIILLLLYLLAIFAGFFSPYSPTEHEFRSYFFHPPTRLHFRDEAGNFHWRPFVAKTYLHDAAGLQYAEGTPAYIAYRYPDANRSPYLPDLLEDPDGVLIIRNERKEVLTKLSILQESSDDSGIFTTAFWIDPFRLTDSSVLRVESKRGEAAEFPIISTAPVSRPAENQNILLLNEKKQPVAAYQNYVRKYPVRFFVRSWKYRILWLFESDLHLFGVEEPGFIFLMGTDQSGRDIFSRVLYGAQISLTVGLIGVFVTTVFGMIIGGIAGYYGGVIDQAIMRLVEILISIPSIYLIVSLRNIIPDRMQDLYDRIRELVQETFAWQNNPVVFWMVMLTSTLLLIGVVYRNNWRPARIIPTAFILVFLNFGKHIFYAGLAIADWIVPGTTYLTSQWTFLIIILILSIVSWASMSRVIRGMVLSLREEPYVLASRALGASDLRLIVRHILPNTFSYVIVRATLGIPLYILGEAFLSYLGLGVQEPIPSWGNMLSAAQNLRVLQQFPWTLFPGGAIFVTVLAYNFLGDGLRDALDPKMR